MHLIQYGMYACRAQTEEDVKMRSRKLENKGRKPGRILRDCRGMQGGLDV
jgi:hypothetical protein